MLNWTTHTSTQGDAITPTAQRAIHNLPVEELIRLRRYAEARVLQAKAGGAVTAVRSWALLDTRHSTGLRASEVASRRVWDCLLGYGQASLVIRQGKGDMQHKVHSSPGTQNAPEDVPDVEVAPRRGRLG